MRPGVSITHENRALSNETVDRKKRYSQILEILADGKEMTAREIAVELWNRGYIPTPERNFTAPRLTELSIKGIVEPCGDQKCEWTRKQVTKYRIRVEEN